MKRTELNDVAEQWKLHQMEKKLSFKRHEE